ncbi:cell wall-binding repeat-containing protein [Thermococcus paralvinellae]|uniref:Putative transcriptional regulator n=1 Tax=Thermococcus paralvinellae TaxID=582419 RepID=W0I8D2_9EURY|nr:cell wall-binding repeat-containing protein [Thermococcus paralvinellae]AHF80725.1 putative transcriptional regulator [Thermococcus paralvinellae]
MKNKGWVSLSLLILLAVSLVSLTLFPVKAQENKPQYDLIIVRNDDLIDYIVALPYSKKTNAPILPVNPKMLDEKTRAQLYSYAQLGWRNVLIIGNSNAVSKEVEDELLSLGFSVTRIGGEVRTETAEKLAVAFYPQGSSTVVLASAMDYGSALAAAKFAMEYELPLLLTLENDLSEHTIAGLKKLHPRLVIIIGTGLNETIEKKLQEMGYETYWMGHQIEPLPISKPEEPSPIPWVVIGAVISLAIAVPIILYWAKKRWAANRVPIEVLTEKERIVVKAILEKGGKVKQEDLPELTGYSRPTVSRIVQELEKKQLVTREKVGKTFIVKLIKEINLKE